MAAVTTYSGDQPTVTGSRVRLRPWRGDDAEAVFAACQDAEIQRWTEVPVPYRREHAAGFVGEIAAQTWAAGGGAFAVEAPGGDLAGAMTLFPPRDGRGVGGYWTVAGTAAGDTPPRRCGCCPAGRSMWWDSAGWNSWSTPPTPAPGRSPSALVSAPRGSCASGRCTAGCPSTTSPTGCSPERRATLTRARQAEPSCVAVSAVPVSSRS